MTDPALRGKVIVLGRRLSALRGAIDRQNFKDIEFIYDQAIRAFERVEAELTPDGEAAIASDPDVEELRTRAAESDTFSFTITNMHPEDRDLTFSAEAIEVTGDKIRAWIAARIIQAWTKTALAPKFAKIDVKVGVE